MAGFAAAQADSLNTAPYLPPQPPASIWPGAALAAGALLVLLVFILLVARRGRARAG